MTKLQELTKAIQKAVPKIMIENKKELNLMTGEYVETNGPRPITLEDVLKVMGEFGKGILFGGSNNSFYQKSDNKVEWLSIQWKLGEPLTQQTQETINFLHNLICKDEK